MMRCVTPKDHRPGLFAALVAVLALLPFGICSAQSDTARPDTTARDSAAPSTPQPENAASTGYTMTKSPTAAVLYSILPGGGQIYTRQYFKAALFIGAAGFFAGQTVYYHTRFSERADELQATPATDAARRDLLRRQREFYRDNRDLNAAYFIGVQILSMIDAYVGAHLFDFDVDDDVSSQIRLDPARAAVGFSVRW